MTDWTLYILKCQDDSYYTGITNNLDKRLTDHASGKGAKYMRGRSPFTLVFQESHQDRSGASRREAEIKKFSRTEKETLIAQNL